ncbi:hypothetical protein Tco_0511927 [Tanacetum coccineum]
MGYEKLTQKLTFYKALFSPQWKFLIHTILQCLSAKTTAWNEFCSTMASAIICLATNQNFNFSKYIFDNIVKNLEGGVKFLMYPRFVQLFMNQQLGDMSHHKRIFVTPSHTKKVFGNIKREGKGFSGRVSPLFPTMMVQAHEEMGEGSTNPTDPHHIITQPSTSQPQKKQPRRKQRKDIEVPQPSEVDIVLFFCALVGGYKQSQLKNKSFAEIQKLFDKAMTRVNMFVDMDTELVEGSEKRSEDSTKRAGTELEQEVAKKQKIDDDQEEA